VIENLVYAFIVVFSLTLAVIAARAFRESGKSKTMLLVFAFMLFFAKGILLSIQLFTDVLNDANLWIASGLLDIGILAAIFLATLKP
jgi:hypothetical protein